MQTQTMTSDDFDLVKFIKLMKMTTATIDGEALAAIRMANKMLRTNGHDWEQLLKGKITIVNDPFGSIPTPPAAKAAPPPPPPKPAPPPPQRQPRNHGLVTGFLAILQAASLEGALDSQESTKFQQIEVEWNYHQALFDADYHWLQSKAQEWATHPRDRSQVQQFLDVLELAQLTTVQNRRVARIRTQWYKRSDGMMSNSDYFWLEQSYRHHSPRGPRGGKAKRLI